MANRRKGRAAVLNRPQAKTRRSHPPGLTKHSGPSVSDGSQLIIEKLRSITFPSIQFENARLDEVVTYFPRQKSRVGYGVRR